METLRFFDQSRNRVAESLNEGMMALTFVTVHERKLDAVSNI